MPAVRTVEFYDLHGRLVQRAAAALGSVVGAGLPAGHYVLVASGTAEARTQRLTVQ